MNSAGHSQAAMWTVKSELIIKSCSVNVALENHFNFHDNIDLYEWTQPTSKPDGKWQQNDYQYDAPCSSITLGITLTESPLSTPRSWKHTHTQNTYINNQWCSQQNARTMGNTYVCLIVWLGEKQQAVHTVGCNADGWQVTGLNFCRIPPPHRAWGGAECAQQ